MVIWWFVRYGDLSWFLLPYFTLISKTKTKPGSNQLALGTKEKKSNYFGKDVKSCFRLRSFLSAVRLLLLRGCCTPPRWGHGRLRSALRQGLPSPCEFVRGYSNQFQASWIKGINTHSKHPQNQSKLSKKSLFPSNVCVGPLKGWTLFFFQLFFQQDFSSA